ncbi:MAG: autorepressor SdpR family transcription factor [Cytophagaceae bacterium]|nr:autorepressor SdpR family transcription factor [Cytophagaceae bacterium]
MNALFKALNDPTRRQILELLQSGDLSAGDIAEQFAMTKPSISHHLDLLRQADLVVSVKRGQNVIYSLNTTVLDEMMAWIFKLRQKPDEPEIALNQSNHNSNN